MCEAEVKRRPSPSSRYSSANRQPTATPGRQTVETIALELGYGSASACISMLRKLMGMAPDDFRKGASAVGSMP